MSKQVVIVGAGVGGLGDISEEDARAEGYPTQYDYLVAFQKINHISDDDFTDMLKTVVWVVHFKVVE